jgi:hypothetical protein
MLRRKPTRLELKAQDKDDSSQRELINSYNTQEVNEYMDISRII